jgi:hypothetical protein
LAALLAVGRGLHRVASALPMADGTRVCAYRRVPVVFNLGAFAERPRLRFSAGPAGLALAHGLPNHGGHSGDVCIWPRGFDTTTMPVFELPGPSGAFRVGTTRFSLLDSSHPETFTADRRELLIQAWYPAEWTMESVPERLWGYPREIAGRMTRSLGLPGFLFDHFALVETH